MTSDDSRLLVDLIAATNRNTRATRAIAKFILIQITAGLVAGLVFAIGENFRDRSVCEFGICPTNIYTLFFSLLIILIGLIWAVIEGWNELKESQIPILPLVTEASRHQTASIQRATPVSTSNAFSSGTKDAKVETGTDGQYLCSKCKSTIQPDAKVCYECNSWIR